MVRIEDFHIQFDDKWAVYHPGDTVTGVVNLRINDKIFVDKALAHFYGIARVLWIQREAKNGDFLNIGYTSEKIFFDDKLELWRYSGKEKVGQVEASKATLDDPFDKELEELLQGPRRRSQLPVNSGPHLTAGTHAFTFAFRLPPDLPTSFDARHSDGYIRYSVKICLMSQDAIKHSRKAYFTVVKPQDLNLMAPAIHQPAIEQAKKLCKNSLFGDVTPDCYIRLSASMEKRGYVPGEPIFVKVEMENRARKSVKLFKVHLVQHVVCHVDKPEVLSKSATHVVATVSKTDKIRQGSNGVWNAGPVYIPAVVPSFNLEDSMVVSYYMLVEAYRDHDWPKLEVRLPIVIGTVPLQSEAGKVMPVPSYDSLPLYDNIVGIPPPSYEESVAGISGSKEKEEEACVPRYVFYKYQ